MKLLIDIPKEFVVHFEQDKFAVSLERVKADIHKSLITSDTGLAGNYELELIEMLIGAFKNCKRVNTTTISDAPLMERELLEQAKDIINCLVHLGEFNENTDEEYLNYQVHDVLKRAEQFLNDEVKE